MSGNADGAWDREWAARQKGLERLLGPSSDHVFHALIPFALGGSADVLEFPQYVPGTTYVTADLTGPSSEQRASKLGQYELMICTRQPEEWAPQLISWLARYTLEAVLKPSETMDIAPAMPEGSTIAALLFAEPSLTQSGFRLLGKRCRLLLCIGITTAELEASLDGRTEELLALLKERDIFPYTELHRESVL